MDSQMQDSLGTVSATSGQSSNASTPKAQIVSQMARLGAVYGRLKDRSPEMIELMAEEWCRALRCFAPATIERAVTSVINSKKFWPVIAEVVAACEDLEMAASLERQRVDDARRAAEDARHIPDPYESFCRAALSFIRSKQSISEDFRAAGVTTILGEIALFFETVEAAHRIARNYGEALDTHLGFHVPIYVEPAPTPTTRVIHPKWAKTAAPD